MEVNLVRHTTPAIEKGICYGQTDLDLAESFLREAAIVKEKLNLVQEDYVIYSSPLKRCLKLAKYLFDKETIRIDERIKELHFGDWEMKKWDAIEKTLLDQWMQNFVQSACPNGESFNDLYRRCCSFWKDLLQQNHPKVIVVTHGGVIRSLLSHVRQTPLDQAFSLKVEYGSVHLVRTSTC